MIKHFFALILSICFLYGFSQDTVFCEQVLALQNLVETEHFSPKTLNDSTSKAVQDLFLMSLDPNKDYFSQMDIKNFKTEALQFDDFIKHSNCDFIKKYSSVLEDRISYIKRALEKLRTETLDYSGSLTLQYIPKEETTYYADETALKQRLSKRVGFRIITKLIDEEPDIKTIKNNFNTLESKAKQTVIDQEICLLNELINKPGGIEAFVEASFLNALVQVNDPNSTFFNITEKITYENQLSKNQLSFGIITKKNDLGDILIAYIIPGSAAFETGKFDEDDILMAIANETVSLETTCVSNEEILLFLNKEEHNTLTFSIKKKNGTIQDVKLSKSKIKVEDNAIRGYIIEDDYNLGYIKIPSFYTNDESPSGRGLTADIAKELYKLQKENIKGLILDLRFNGGGSMQEAIELSGMFIDRGPVSIIKSKSGEDYTIRDNKRGTFFNKPLLILVNDYSASASEFFSAAMQDYNRAIIVGSTTFGKSTAQIILPLSETKDLGFSKLTVEAFFRVTGKSHQAVGIIPDITLPSLYANFQTSERDKLHALKNTVTEVYIKHKALKKVNLNTIITKSNNRVATNTDFQKISEINKALFTLLFTKGPKYTLTLEAISNEKKRKKEILDFIFEENIEKPLLLTFKNTNFTNELLEYNLEDKTQNNATLTTLSQDIYINEAQNILKNYINPN